MSQHSLEVSVHVDHKHAFYLLISAEKDESGVVESRLLFRDVREADRDLLLTAVGSLLEEVIGSPARYPHASPCGNRENEGFTGNDG